MKLGKRCPRVQAVRGRTDGTQSSNSEARAGRRTRVLLFACGADDAHSMMKYGVGMEIAYLPSDDLREVREEIERFKPKLVLCDANVFLDAISQSPATVARKRQKVGEPPLAEAVPSISNQEKKILSMLAKGLKNDEIAQVLRVSARTVKRVLSNLFERLDVTNRTELIGRASELSLLEDDE